MTDIIIVNGARTAMGGFQGALSSATAPELGAITIKEAITFIEQGQVRVGTQVITDPAFLVTRSLEDHITWTNRSKIRRKIMEYKGKVDDYDMMN